MIRTIHMAAVSAALLVASLLAPGCGDEGTCGEEATAEVISPRLTELNSKYDLVPEGKVLQQVVKDKVGKHKLSSRQVFRLVPRIMAHKEGGFGSKTKSLGGGGIIAKVTVTCETDGCADASCAVQGCQPTATGCSPCACVETSGRQ